MSSTSHFSSFFDRHHSALYLLLSPGGVQHDKRLANLVKTRWHKDPGMKFAALIPLLIPTFAGAANWSTEGFPTFAADGTGKFSSQKTLTKGTRPLRLNFDQQCWQPTSGIRLNQMLSLEPCQGDAPQWRLFRDGNYTLEVDTRSGTPTLTIAVQSDTQSAAEQVNVSRSPVPALGRQTADAGCRQNLPGRQPRSRLL